jgi:FAD/FMN-containing dehydrogenase
MILMDRFARLRREIRSGRLHTARAEILPFLKGKLSKADVPAAVIEPAVESELTAIFQFAAEKKLRVAVASGLIPVEVKQLEGQVLVLTTRLAGSPVISSRHAAVRVEAGLPVESLAIDLTRTGLRWLPLWPVPPHLSVGQLLAMGWEGLRTWSCGSTLPFVRAIEWVAYDGNAYRSSTFRADGSADVRGFLFGSRGALGVITRVEMDGQASPRERTAALFELPGATHAMELLAALRSFEPLPESVVYYGETATRLLREGNDRSFSDHAVVLLAAEWSEAIELWPEEWSQWAKPLREESAVNTLWQDLLRFPRTAARLYPARTEARVKLPVEALSSLEEAAGEFGREFNMPVVLWGTPEAGHVHLWVLQPDDQQRTSREAGEVLRKMFEIVVELGGRQARGSVLPFATSNASSRDEIGNALLSELVRRCDPFGLHIPLTGMNH